MIVGRRLEAVPTMLFFVFLVGNFVGHVILFVAFRGLVDVATPFLVVTRWTRMVSGGWNLFEISRQMTASPRE